MSIYNVDKPHCDVQHGAQRIPLFVILCNVYAFNMDYTQSFTAIILQGCQNGIIFTLIVNARIKSTHP